MRGGGSRGVYENVVYLKRSVTAREAYVNYSPASSFNLAAAVDVASAEFRNDALSRTWPPCLAMRPSSPSNKDQVRPTFHPPVIEHVRNRY